MPIDSMTKSQFTQSHIFIDPKQTDTIQAILYKQYRSFDIIHPLGNKTIYAIYRLCFPL